MHPGSRAPELRVDAGAGPLGPASAPTNFSLLKRVTERAPAVKVLHLVPRGGAFLAVESSERFPLRDRVIKCILVYRETEPAGLDSPGRNELDRRDRSRAALKFPSKVAIELS